MKSKSVLPVLISGFLVVVCSGRSGAAINNAAVNTIIQFVLSDEDGCLISTPQGCPNNPSLPNPYWDDFDGSSNNGPRCLLRANEFAVWCGAGSVTATFGDGTSAVAGALIHPVSMTASNTYAGYPPSLAIDGDPNTSWNSGGFPDQWIQLDLGAYYEVTHVKLLVMQSPSGDTNHIIYGGGHTPGDMIGIGAYAGVTQTGQWLDVPTSSSRWIRYVLIRTMKSPSWVGWSEIQVFGNSVVRLPTVSASAPSASGNNAALLAIDGNNNTGWLSSGLPIQWIQVDLGASYDVAGVKLLPQSSSNQASHVVYGGQTVGDLAPIGGYSGAMQIDQWLDVPVDARSIRYLKVQTVEGSSGVGWSEIQVYGTSLNALTSGQVHCGGGLIGRTSLAKLSYFLESAWSDDNLEAIAGDASLSWQGGGLSIDSLLRSEAPESGASQHEGHLVPVECLPHIQRVGPNRAGTGLSDPLEPIC